MQSTNLCRWLVILGLTAGVWPVGADSTNTINGPYAPGADGGPPPVLPPVPGGATWLSSSTGRGEIGWPGGVGWLISDVELANSNNVGVWWGGVSNGVKFSYVDNTYTRTGEVLKASARSDLAKGKMVWEGKTQYSTNLPVDTRFTMLLRESPSAGWGQALSFDGSDDQVRVPGVNLTNSSLTLEIWAKRDNTGTLDGLIGHGTNRTAGKELVFGFWPTNSMRFTFVDTPGVTTAATYFDLEWHHWAATFDQATMLRCIYRDGVLVATGTNAVSYTGSGLLIIGGLALPGGAFKGLLDEVRIWNVARSQEDITADMGRPLTGKETNLLAYWNFDEGTGTNVVDISGHGYLGSIIGAVRADSGISVGDTTLSLDGVNDFVQSRRNIDLANKSFTVEAWAQRDSLGTWDAVIGQGPSVWGNNNQNLFFGFHPNGVEFGLYFWPQAIGTAVNPTDRAWHHWAATFNTTNKVCSLYRDGNLVSSATASANFQGPSGPLFVGNTPWSENNDAFDGRVDEVRIWDVVRSQAEIAATMGRPLTGGEPNLLVYWNFNDASGTNVNDGTRNDNDGMLINSPEWAEEKPWGSALSFNGTSTVQIPNFGRFRPTNEITVEVWVRIDTNRNEWPIIFYSTPDQAANRFLVHLGAQNAAWPNMFWDCGDVNAGGRLTYNSTAPRWIGVWQHFAFVSSKAGNYMKVFRNGIEEASANTFNDLAPGDYGLALGYWFVGDLDEFRVWNEARTGPQIQESMRQALTGSESNLVVYYRFDEKKGSRIAYDSGPYGLHGTLVDGPGWVDTTAPLAPPSPLALIPATALGLSSNAVGVARVHSGMRFHANMYFEISYTGPNGTFFPAYEAYDWLQINAHDTNYPVVGTANSSVRGGFYYGYKPIITAQPTPLVGRTTGSNVTFSVTAIGLQPLAYEWWQHGMQVTNANTRTLTLTNLQYNATNVVVVRNLAGNTPGNDAVLLVTNTPGYPIEPPPGANLEVYKEIVTGPACVPTDAATWNFTDRRLTAANKGGLLTVTWKDANTNDLIRSLFIREVPAVPYFLGKQILPPNTSIDTNREPAITDNSDCVFWHPARKRLYAVGPGTVNITWFTTNGSPLVATVENDWPTNESLYQIHVAGSPAVKLTNWTETWASLRWTLAGADSLDVRSRSEFHAPKAGKSLLLISQGDPKSPTNQNFCFQFVKTIEWSDPGYLHDHAPAIIGENISDDFGYHTANVMPHFANRLSAYCTNFYNPDADSPMALALIPVNRDRTGMPEDDFVLVFWQYGTQLWDPYLDRQITSETAWPYKPVRYDCEWPADAPTIVIASGKGSGPIQLEDWSIYYQNDTNAPGFNPNDEHAVRLQAGAEHLVPRLRTDPQDLMVLEGGWGKVDLWLSSKPPRDVRVEIMPSPTGDTNLFSTNGIVNFATDNWDIPQTIWFKATEDPDSLNGARRFTLGVSGGLYATNFVNIYEADTNKAGLMVDGLVSGVPEGGSRELNVRLTKQPPADVTVELQTRTMVDPPIIVEDTNVLVFTAQNWATNQVVRLIAPMDNDRADESIGFRLESSGGLEATKDMLVTAWDKDLAGSGIFALRDDLGDALESTNSVTSEPYVLLTYTNAEGAAAMKVFRVVLEDGNDDLDYPGEAGQQLHLFKPLVDFLDKERSYGTNGPFWKDRTSQFWAKAAGNDGGSNRIVMKYFYRHYPELGFYYRDGLERPAETPIAWQEVRSGRAGVPADVAYTVRWPFDPPKLSIGETLVDTKNRLPMIDGQPSVEVLYQQGEKLGWGTNANVMLIDPTWQYTATLTNSPSDAKITESLGREYFAELPPFLRSRFWYDKMDKQLVFEGKWVPSSGFAEPQGYLLLNVITARDLEYLRAVSTDTNYHQALSNLATQAAQPRQVGPNDVFRDLALTAGIAKGTGYVTLAFGSATNLNPEPPIELKVIQVTCPLYQGDLKTLYSDDPFSEEVALRHTGDFAGQADQYEFQWQYYQGSIPPVDENDWQGELPLVQRGALDQVVPGKNEASNIKVLVDGLYRCRYRSTNMNHACANNPPPGWSVWTAPASVEGWAKRVGNRINFFGQMYDDLQNYTVDTTVNIISKSGARWIGDVPFDVDALKEKGLIEIYESILNRAIKLSIEAAEPVRYDPDCSTALMSIARRLSDLYMALGNEAYADASDPTIGFGTTSGQNFAQYASSIHCFMGQTPSLIAEELALLRGIDDSTATSVMTHPAYNKLRWNFVGDMFGGQTAYVLNYSITDKDGNSATDEKDAKLIWPQGHGDAWGHYLTAVKNFYRLLRNPNFVWVASEETVTIDENPVQVGFQDERKFAQAAAAKARTGAEIVSLTYRSAYVEDPTGQWQGYLDGDTNRAWGVSEWASRSGQGAYFDWVVGNAMLPSEDTSHSGPAKVDRRTVTDLREISATYLNVQDEMDKADLGLNPLGLANNVLPFDIDPDKVKNKITHFEQVHERAVTALNNAIAVFNEAVNCSQQLRSQSDSLIQFQNNVWDREVDFTNRLIEIYGYPYPEDIGPGGTYATGYKGPDLEHFNYTDFSEITGETPPVGVQYTVTNLGTAVRPNGSLMETAKPVSYYLAENGIQTKPPTWTGKRAAPGELQNAQSDLLQARARFSRSLKEYDKLLAEIETQAGLLRAQYKVNATEIYILVKEKGVQESLNQMIFRSRAVQTILGTVARSATIMANALAEALPKAVGLATDAFAPARSAIMIGGSIVSEIANTGAGVASMVELHHQQAKEMAQAKQNIELTCLRQEIPILTQLAQLQQLVRQEALLRLEIYTQQEAMQQMAGRYLAALQRGIRLQEDLLRFRQQTASQVQQARYKDMAFRIFRNDNLQKYRAQFDLAAMYVYLTAKAYDYETNLRPGDRNQPGSVFFNQIVRARTIGAIVNGIPLTKQAGDGGLADAMARMSANFGVLKPQLGLLNPQKTTLNFSLKRDFMRLVSGQAWRDRLATYRVADLNQVPEFKQHCLPTASEPGLVIPLQTFVNKNVNYFGWPYGPADSKFNEDAFAIRIYSVGISFDNYTTDPNSPRAMAATPDVYLIPVGNDVLRCPRSSSQDDERYTREWKILDQWLPVPFGLGDTNGNLTTAGQQLFSSSDYMPFFASGNDKFFGNSRAYIKFRAWQTGDGPQAEALEDFNSTLLISRSVWNTKWLLVIPASGLGSDYQESLNRFIYGGVNPITGARDNLGVSDVRLRITAYWHSGR